MEIKSDPKYKSRVKILTTQIDLLDHYDPQGRKERRIESFGLMGVGILEQDIPSDYYREIDNLIQTYDLCLSLFRTDDKKTERNPEVRRKLDKLSELCSASQSS